MDNSARETGGAGFGYAMNVAPLQYGGDKVARQTEIPRYSEELAKALAACAQGLDHLENRLSSVTSAEPPSPAREPGAVMAVPQSDVGRRLQEMGGQAMSINARLQSLIRRLEV